MSAIVGGRGSGKTRLLLAIIGMRRLTGATVHVQGIDPFVYPLLVRRLACFVPSQVPILPHLSVIDYVRFLVALGTSRRVEDREIVSALRASELPDRLLRHKSSLLSRYERLCLWLAIHRVRRTSILLLDDPADTLNGRHGQAFARLVRETLVPERSAVITTPDATFANQIGDDIFQLESGRLRPLVRAAYD